MRAAQMSECQPHMPDAPTVMLDRLAELYRTATPLTLLQGASQADADSCRTARHRAGRC